MIILNDGSTNNKLYFLFDFPLHGCVNEMSICSCTGKHISFYPVSPIVSSVQLVGFLDSFESFSDSVAARTTPYTD